MNTPERLAVVPPASADVGTRRDPSPRWFIPYLVAMGLAAIAALLVVIQLWVYRDEIRAIFAASG